MCESVKQAKMKYLLPQPRVDLGISLLNIANSMIDVSDGLVQDGMHLAKNSNLSIELNLLKVPIPKINKIDRNIILDSALYGGDDYELLFSCDPSHEAFIKKLSSKMNIKLTKIGKFREFKNEFLKFKNNSSRPKRSFLHF
mgnify:FL=1